MRFLHRKMTEYSGIGGLRCHGNIYMDKVPYIRGCRAAWHCMEGDLIISRAYVTKKYNIGNDYFVDLTWWCQTYDNYLIEEGSATVKLPKR